MSIQLKTLQDVRVTPQPWSCVCGAVHAGAFLLCPMLSGTPNQVPSVSYLDFEPDEHHTLADMANVGYSLMQAIKAHRPDYAWNESPAEIVGDLCNELDEQR
jgi:hypothetical protein